MKHNRWLIYKDSRYNFTLRIPAWWKNYAVIDKKRYDRSAEYEVRFLFKYRGKTYGDVLNVAVYKMTRREWERRGNDDSPIIIMGERNGRLFTYTTPGELPEQFLDKKKDNYDYVRFGRPIRLMKRMVNDDVPNIVRTFRLPRLKLTRPAPYVAKGAKCGCRKRKSRK